MGELLQELARFFGIEKIAFDAEGFCALRLQDQYMLMLRNDEEQKRLVMVAEIATPATLSNELLTAALSFNFNRIAFSGSWMTLDRETKKLFLADEFSIAMTDMEVIRKRLERFFQDYLACQGIFNIEIMEDLLGGENKGPFLKSQQMA
ncbi:MAG: type III secretion system chaperone [Chthoniobacterales bacterium]|nr:type III secretion system chaperone [Chthoniobacterales bacterium]